MSLKTHLEVYYVLEYGEPGKYVSGFTTMCYTLPEVKTTTDNPFIALRLSKDRMEDFARYFTLLNKYAKVITIEVTSKIGES